MPKFHTYWNFSRPFTQIAPMVGIISGSLMAYAATATKFPASHVAMAALGAAALNAGSNGLNQIFDIENDRVNKPGRPLPAGRLSMLEAVAFTILMYALSLLLAAEVNTQTFVAFLLGGAATAMYSAPPWRLKSRPLGSNVIIALVRGELLQVAGWAVVSSVLDTWEPWCVGLIFFLFLAGAATTKDFADVEGDRAAGCLTLPVKYGVDASARLISPSFVFPWLVMALAAWLRILSASRPAVLALACVLAGWGGYVIVLITRNPRRLVREKENHPAWRHMYGMMTAGRLGLAGAYMLRLLH